MGQYWAIIIIIIKPDVSHMHWYLMFLRQTNIQNKQLFDVSLHFEWMMPLSSHISRSGVCVDLNRVTEYAYVENPLFISLSNEPNPKDQWWEKRSGIAQIDI